MTTKPDFRPVPLDRLVGDPTYQTNLLLWLLIPSTGAVVEPILYKVGYRLKYLEPELPLPLEMINDLAEKNVVHRQEVSPDLLISSTDKDYVTLECKSRMFGSKVQPGSGNSQQKQARSLLLLVPQILASAINLQKKDVASNHIVYLSRHEPQHPQTKGLQELSEELQKLNYRTAPFGLLGLEAVGKKIILRSGYKPGQLPTRLSEALGKKGVLLQQVTDDFTDPRPLYYLPWLPDTTPDDDEYSHSAFEQRIYAAAVAQIGPCRPPCEVVLEVDKLLASATNNLYGQWRSPSMIWL